MFGELVLFSGLVVTLLLTGGLWFVLLVHYPMLRLVDPRQIVALEREHYRRTMPLAVSVMVLEGLLSFLLLIMRPAGLPLWGAVLPMLVLFCGQYLTWARCVPLHRCLLHRSEKSAVEELIRIHRYRVVLWTLRAAFLIVLACLYAIKLK